MRLLGTFSLSTQAAQDLQEIYDFIAPHNSAAAERLIDTLREEFHLLSTFPDIGVKKSGGLRMIPMNEYLIFYRKKRTSIEIVRVLHSARKQSH